jgi:hypothetical protein
MASRMQLNSPWSGARWDASAAQLHRQQNDPDPEENPGDAQDHAGNPRSIEGARHQSDNRKYQCVINHLGLLLLLCLAT